MKAADSSKVGVVGRFSHVYTEHSTAAYIDRGSVGLARSIDTPPTTPYPTNNTLSNPHLYLLILLNIT